MTRLAQQGILLRAMVATDIDAVLQIESMSYSHPWSEGVFLDCIKADYPVWVLLKHAVIIGYIVLSSGAGEAHILNLCIAKHSQRQGMGENLLRDVIEVMSSKGVREVFLEVRASNDKAKRLYEKLGFETIGLRKGYYKSHSGREDALTYKLALSN